MLNINDTQPVIRAGTRGSQLALWQTEFVIARLAVHWPELQFAPEIVQPRGDRDKATPLPALGGKGLFTAELEAGLRDGTMDIAVHSLKDLPIEDPPGLVTAAILARDEVRDVWISRTGATLDELPANAIVGTSSTRRCAQLLARRPDLQVRSIRGNVDTRLRKLDEGLYDAIILAGAGIVRMGQADRVTQWLPVEWFTPAPGQGALGVQCRADDTQARRLLAAIHDEKLATLVAAERGFLAALGGGCSEPVGAYARRHEGAGAETLTLRAWYSAPSGQTAWHEEVRGTNGAALAAEAAHAAQSAVGEKVDGATSPTASAWPRVVLTRSRTADLADCRTLVAAGLQPIVAPVIDMVPALDPAGLDAAVGDPAEVDWIVFTSANAVRIFVEQWLAAGKDIRTFDHAQVAAVGPHTAAAASDYGFRVDFVPETYTGSGLGKHADRFHDSRILLPRSALGDPQLVQVLARHAAAVTEIPLYTPQTLTLGVNTMAALESGVDVVTFASASAVTAFQEAVRPYPGLAGLMQRVPLACIGPQTAAAVRELGFEPAIVSEVHTMPGLLQAVIDFVQRAGLKKEALQ